MRIITNDSFTLFQGLHAKFFAQVGFRDYDTLSRIMVLLFIIENRHKAHRHFQQLADKLRVFF
ncbi:hypothetical protein D3C78_1015980 [compost metagenome]